MIVFENVVKEFGTFRAVDGVSGTVRKGAVVVVCGPSGSGKSTLIRTVNRLEPPDSGRVIVDGVDPGSGKVNINTFRLDIGFVAQQSNLFPHLTALENVAIGLHRLRGMPKREAREAAMEHLSRLGLADNAHQYPVDLSGGQAQRVAIVRAIAMNTRIMLLDEPTSALDPEMIGEVLALLRSLADAELTMMCVTHEMGFAREVSDEVWFMDHGRLIETAPPSEFFSAPRHARAREFVSRLQSH